MFKTTHIFCCFVTIAVVQSGCNSHHKGSHSSSTDDSGSSNNVKVEDIETMQVEVPDDYVAKLKAVIDNEANPYVRERAVLTMTEIAVRRHEVGDIASIITEVAENESDDSVRTAAYASLDLMRSYDPPAQQSSLELSVSGDLKKGNTIALIARVSSKIDVEKEAILAIRALHKNIELVSGSMVQKVRLAAGAPQEIQYQLKVNEAGSYFIPVSLLVSHSRSGYEKLREKVRFVVE